MAANIGNPPPADVQQYYVPTHFSSVNAANARGLQIMQQIQSGTVHENSLPDESSMIFLPQVVNFPTKTDSDGDPVESQWADNDGEYYIQRDVQFLPDEIPYHAPRWKIDLWLSLGCDLKDICDHITMTDCKRCKFNPRSTDRHELWNALNNKLTNFRKKEGGGLRILKDNTNAGARMGSVMQAVFFGREMGREKYRRLPLTWDQIFRNTRWLVDGANPIMYQPRTNAPRPAPEMRSIPPKVIGWLRYHVANLQLPSDEDFYLRHPNERPQGYIGIPTAHGGNPLPPGQGQPATAGQIFAHPLWSTIGLTTTLMAQNPQAATPNPAPSTTQATRSRTANQKLTFSNSASASSQVDGGSNLEPTLPQQSAVNTRKRKKRVTFVDSDDDEDLLDPTPPPKRKSWPIIIDSDDDEDVIDLPPPRKRTKVMKKGKASQKHQSYRFGSLSHEDNELFDQFDHLRESIAKPSDHESTSTNRDSNTDPLLIDGQYSYFDSYDQWGFRDGHQRFGLTAADVLRDPSLYDKWASEAVQDPNGIRDTEVPQNPEVIDLEAEV
ncbi:hypothetical protein EJ08DRAFT_735224 [Tothia fuscella]|uniref:Uncharacterized protein n=1 Tax=Tothia fuscella TaxID=1048955 RepID=A0A9P4NNE3_9PEZI|nr:hypothetical protein EJ08DRAFT_735224 [Tothia fuscella]